MSVVMHSMKPSLVHYQAKKILCQIQVIACRIHVNKIDMYSVCNDLNLIVNRCLIILSHEHAFAYFLYFTWPNHTIWDNIDHFAELTPSASKTLAKLPSLKPTKIYVISPYQTLHTQKIQQKLYAAALLYNNLHSVRR